MAEDVVRYAGTAAGVHKYFPDTRYPYDPTASVGLAANESQHILVEFPDAVPDAYLFRPLVRAQIEAVATAFSSAGGRYAEIYAAALSSGFDAETVTWNTMPESSNRIGLTVKSGGASLSSFPETWEASATGDPSDAPTAAGISRASKALIKTRAVKIYGPSYSNTIDYYNVSGQIQLALTFESGTVTSQIAQTDSPITGTVNRKAPTTFKWIYGPSGTYSCVGDFVQASARLYWKLSTDETWTEIVITTAEQSVTIPPDTFPSGTVQWYLVGTDTRGTTSQSETYSFSTVAPLLSAAPISPNGEIVDRAKDVTFRWSVTSFLSNDTIGADLQYSTDGSTWTNLGHKTSTEPEATVAASRLPLGTVYWRVRAYNIDNAVGAWSSAAAFVVVGAPDAPSVTVEAVPFATIRWQGDGQQAYRITVDGSVYGPFFGDAKSYTLQDYLEDGAHTATVEMQGAYGLWSQPGEAQFEIQNVPGEPITLRGRMHIDAQLDWTGGSAAAEFLVYRDGRRIGRTRGAAFLDRLTLGTHDWQVIGRLADGNYTPSNVITGTLASCPPRIAPAAGGDWLELTMSENSSRAIETAESRPVSLRHFEGAEYPVAETTPYRDASIPFDMAWTYGQTDEARRFEALLAQPVIFKTGDGCVVGILSAYVRRSVRFYRSYSCTLQRIHWEDFVDDTDD